jgi:hypothetical protein
VTALEATSEAAFQFMLITNSPVVATHAVASGVDLVFVDLEIKGKHERQPGRSTVISGHTLDDVARVRAVVPSGRLLVRLNPWDVTVTGGGDQVVALGADHVMLPMFRGPAELESLVRKVDGRCSIVGLLETAEAADGAARDSRGRRDCAPSYRSQRPAPGAKTAFHVRAADRRHGGTSRGRAAQALSAVWDRRPGASR